MVYLAPRPMQHAHKWQVQAEVKYILDFHQQWKMKSLCPHSWNEIDIFFDRETNKVVAEHKVGREWLFLLRTRFGFRVYDKLLYLMGRITTLYLIKTGESHGDETGDDL